MYVDVIYYTTPNASASRKGIYRIDCAKNSQSPTNANNAERSKYHYADASADASADAAGNRNSRRMNQS